VDNCFTHDLDSCQVGSLCFHFPATSLKIFYLIPVQTKN
jgi:hypothetical protein